MHRQTPLCGAACAMAVGCCTWFLIITTEQLRVGNWTKASRVVFGDGGMLVRLAGATVCFSRLELTLHGSPVICRAADVAVLPLHTRHRHRHHATICLQHYP